MDKMRQWTLLAVLAVVVILLGGYMLLVKPKSDEAADLRATAEAQLVANRRLQQDIERLNEQARDLPRQQAKLAAFGQRIPANPALPSLIRSLTDAADRAGVELVSLAPSPPVPVEAAAPAAAASPAPGSPGVSGRTAAAPAAGDPLYAINLNVTIRGGFIQMQQFFSNVEDLTRTFTVNTFTAAAVQSQSGATRTGDLETAIVGRVFMTLPSTPAAPAVPAATSAPAAGSPAPGAPAQPTTAATASPTTAATPAP